MKNNCRRRMAGYDHTFTEDKKIDYDAVLRILSGMIRTGLTEFLRYASQVKCLS